MDKDKINTCFSCGLVDEQVEAGGIYHCPNPFCDGCGATYWKTENLKVNNNEIVDMKEWLTKGIEHINKLPYELGNKIMKLKKTKDTMNSLTQEYENNVNRY